MDWKFKSQNPDSLFKTTDIQYIFTARGASDRAIVVSNISGKYQLHAVDFDSGFHRQLTSHPQGTLFGSISSDGEYVYMLNSMDGSEHGHFQRIPFEGGEKEDITPNYGGYFAYFASDSESGDVISFRASIDNENNILVAQRENDSYTTHEMYSSENTLSEAVCAPSGNLVCTSETENKTNDEKLILLSIDKEPEVAHLSSLEEGKPLAFSLHDPNRLLILGRKSNWQRPFFYNISNNRLAEISHPTFSGNVWVLGWIEAEDKLIVCDNYQAKQRLYVLDTQTMEARRVGPTGGSFGYHFGSVAQRKDDSFVTQWSDFNISPRLITVTESDSWYEYRKKNELFGLSNGISTNYVVENIQTKSSDGQEVQAWVVRPEGDTDPIPFVIDVHGGPHGAKFNEFSPKAQAWLRSGVGYCAVNYRGSTGFGREFKNKIYGNPGYWEVEDVVAIRKWLTGNDYADPDQVILYGWSWGGYVVLLALGKYPDLWSVGIAGEAIADCVMQYEDEPAYFKAQDRRRFGGTPETALDQYVDSSPITYAENVKAPILLFHGENDVRCPPRQIKKFQEKLKKNNKSVSVEWLDVGHIGEFTDVDLRAENMQKTIDFIKKTL